MTQEELIQEPRGGRQELIKDLVDGQQVDSPFAVRGREMRQKKNGEDFLKLELGDKSGTLQALAWDNARSFFDLCPPGAVVRVLGDYSVHKQYGPQLKVNAVLELREEDYDAADLMEGPATPVEQLEKELQTLILTVENPHLRLLLGRFFGETGMVRFREAPAAMRVHQAYRGGLLEHTLSVGQAVNAAAAIFPGVDRELALTGALLHDYGKTDAYNADPFAINLTDAGKLETEIPLTYFQVRTEIASVEDFPEELGSAVLHIILSHHGDHGPVQPATREAILVHAIDKLGANLGTFDRLEKEAPDGESWSRYDPAAGGSVFLG